MEENINTEETKEKVEDEKLDKVNGGWPGRMRTANPLVLDSSNQNTETGQAVADLTGIRKKW